MKFSANEIRRKNDGFVMARFKYNIRGIRSDYGGFCADSQKKGDTKGRNLINEWDVEHQQQLW
jgi:hypothetical protein